MRTLFTTDAVHPRDRYDLWHEVACKAIIGHESHPKDRPRFDAALTGAFLANIDVVVFDVAPMDAARTARNIADTPNDSLLVCRQLCGKVAFEQAGRQIVLTPGAMTLMDAQRPYTAKFADRARMLVLKLPRRDIEARFGRTEDVTALELRRDDPVVALTSAHLGMLPACTDSIDATAAETVARYTLDLIALSLSKTACSSKPMRSATRSLAATNLRAFIDSRMRDPALNPASAAA